MGVSTTASPSTSIPSASIPRSVRSSVNVNVNLNLDSNDARTDTPPPASAHVRQQPEIVSNRMPAVAVSSGAIVDHRVHALTFPSYYLLFPFACLFLALLIILILIPLILCKRLTLLSPISTSTAPPPSPEVLPLVAQNAVAQATTISLAAPDTPFSSTLNSGRAVLSDGARQLPFVASHPNRVADTGASPDPNYEVVGVDNRARLLPDRPVLDVHVRSGQQVYSQPSDMDQREDYQVHSLSGAPSQQQQNSAFAPSRHVGGAPHDASAPEQNLQEASLEYGSI